MYGSGQGQSYQDLISIAKQNADEAKKRVNNIHMFPSTSKQKRVDPKQAKLSHGIQQFLKKQEEEERKKKEEEQKKKQRLMELRHQDRKATNRVKKMLSMTKSANKSCVDDAKDSLNAAVTAQAQGDFQPDEDDYGYTSNYADQMHKKMMEKYKSIPVKPAFPQSRLAAPKPMAQSLHRRHKAEYNPDVDRSPEQNHSEPEPSTSKKPNKATKAPPKPQLPDYNQLLQIAKEKSQNPHPLSLPVIEKKVEKEEFEFGRPMTAREKKKFLIEKEFKERAARKFDLKSDSNNNSSSGGIGLDSRNGKDKPSTSFKIPKASKGREDNDAKGREEMPPPPKKSKFDHVKPVASETLKAKSNETISESNGSSSANSKSSILASRLNGKMPQSSATTRPQDKFKQGNSHHSPPSSHSSSKSRDRDPPHHNMQKPNGHSSKPENDKRPDRIPQERLELIKEKPKYLSAFVGRGRDQERKQVPSTNDSKKPIKPSTSRDIQPPSRSSDTMDKNRNARSVPDHHNNRKPMNHERMPPPQRRERDGPSRGPQPRIREEPPRMKPKPNRGRAIIDSDEEYDSEMDDFIDDSEADIGNISAEISRIFKYDRRRYEYDESDDDECMESSVAEQLREEQRSLRIGIQEDMEDIRREEEEKRIKTMKMKKGARV